MKNIYTILLLILLPVFSFSQKVEPRADSTKVREVELGEIIISGSKNEMTLKSLPTSVTLLSKTTIQDDNITCLPDITSVAPGVFMPSYGSKLTSPIYIRGIGSRINSPGVGLYVDNVPFFEKSAFNFDFFDIERIEILKGPQGTLYGRNTIGGVINVKTLSPFDFQGVKAKVGVGSYGQYEANAGYYNKFNEQLAVSLTAMYNHRDGFYTNETTNKQVDESDVYSVRNKVIWKPIKEISIENIASMEYSEEGGYPYAVYDSVAGEANPVSYNDYSSYLRKMFSDALVMRYTTENIELKATTAYQYLDDEQQIDQDFTPDSGYFVTQNQKQHMLSQEIIVRSKGNSVYNWLVGGFAFQQTFDKTVDVLVYTPGMTVLKTYDHTIEGAALFHQSELTFNNLKLIGGIRVETESDEQDYLYDRVMGGNVTTYDDTIAKNEFFEILPKVALNYKLNGTNLYASVSRGYKTGGFNSSFDENHPEHMTFEPEHSMNYEIGMKTSLLNKQLYADVALYYIDWENQQIYESNLNGRGSHLTNAGNSVSTGFEASLKTIPFCGYVTSLSYSYNHATFVNYVVNDSVNYNGNFLPYAPQHTVSVRLSKTFQLHNSNIIDKMRISLLYTGVGKIYWNEENTTSQDYYNLVSSNITFMKDGFGLSFWRKNMLEEKYHTFAFNAMGNQYVQLGQPSRYGVRLTYNF